MAETTIALSFNGYWREPNISGIPKTSGIYVVYECFHEVMQNTVTLQKVIYIGESDDVNHRISTHEKWSKWRAHCGPSKEVCISYASVSGADKQRGEAAMINHHKPPVNDEYKSDFPFDKTTISLSGATALLDTFFTVYRTTPARAY